MVLDWVKYSILSGLPEQLLLDSFHPIKTNQGICFRGDKSMPKKFTFEEVKESIKKTKKYFLVDTEYKNSYSYLTLSDNDGYLYSLNWSGIAHHLKTGNNNLRPFHVNNPFTIQNIILWLEKNKTLLKYIGGDYKRQGKLTFLCETCGETFDSRWPSICNGDRCPFCSGRRVGKNNNLLAKYPDICEEWDYNTNKKGPNEYTWGSRERVWWICKTCGRKWLASIDHRSRMESFCQYCESLERCFPEIALEWNYKKNYPHLPSQFKKRSKKKFFWTCQKCGKIWNMSIQQRTRSFGGCPKCHYSLGESKIDGLLEQLKVNYASQWKFSDCKNINELSYDFFLPDFNIAVEYDGKYHYEIKYYSNKSKQECQKEFELVKLRDSIKNKYCYENGINLIRIPYWDYDNIENIIKEKLNL